MHVLIDNLTAVLVGGAVFLMALFVYQSDREALVEATAFYAMIRHQEDFAKTLTNDLQGIEQVLTVSIDSDDRFIFRGFIAEDGSASEIAYEREQVRQKDGLTYYRIRRLVRAPGSLLWKEVGGSADVITDWQIEGRDANGDLAASPAAVEEVFVHFQVGSRLRASQRVALGETARVDRSIWEASFYPPLLQ